MNSSGDHQGQEAIGVTSDNSNSNSGSNSSGFSIGTTHIADAEYSLAFDLHLDQAMTSEDQEAKDIFHYAAMRSVDSLFHPIHYLPHEMILLQGDLHFRAEDPPFNGNIDAQSAHQIRMRKKKEYFGTMQQMFPHGVSCFPSRAPSRAPSKANSKSPSKYAASQNNYSVRYGLKGATAGQSRSSGSNTPNQNFCPLTRSASVFSTSTGTAEDSTDDFPWNDFNASPTKLSALLKKYETKMGIDVDPITATRSPFEEGEGNDFPAKTLLSVEYQELKRRLDIIRALEKAEEKRLLAEKIQRKGNIKLKLRSLKDPTVSLEREQLLSRQGNKRTNTAIPSISLDRSSSPVRKSSSSNLLPSRSSDPTNPTGNLSELVPSSPLQPEMTYRKEDYEEIDSELLFVDKTGELLLGKNCLLVARKEKKDLIGDLYPQSLIEPNINLPLHPVISSSNGHGVTFQTATPHNSPERPLLGTRNGSRQQLQSLSSSPTKVSSPIVPTPENVQGRFEAFAKLEFQSDRTPLAKGVVMKNITPEPHEDKGLLTTASFLLSQSQGQLSAPPVLNEVKTPAKSPLKKSHPNGASGNNLSPSRAPTDGATSGRTTTPANGPPSPTGILPKNVHAGEKYFQNVRIRTPACRNRTSKKAGFDLGMYDEDFSMSTFDPLSVMDHHKLTSDVTTDETSEHSPSRMSPSFKKKYMREFPVLPPGQIRVVDNAQNILNPSVSPIGHSFFMSSSSNTRHVRPSQQHPSSSVQ